MSESDFDSGMEYGGMGYDSDEPLSPMGYDQPGESPFPYEEDPFEERKIDSPFGEEYVDPAPRLVADFEQIQQSTSEFGNLGTRIASGEFDGTKDKRAKLLELLKVITATPEKRFEVFLMQDSRDFSGIIPDKYFSIVQGIVSQGLVPNYGRFSPLGMVLGLMAISPSGQVTPGSVKKINKILEQTETVNLAVVLKYARWWQNFRQNVDVILR